MKGVILPTTKTADLAPLTSWLPEFLLPVVNKPVVEHLIELLARHAIKDILLVLKHLPFETEAYFGDGSRWGVRLSYSLLRTYCGLVDALGHLDPSRIEEPFLCLPSDIVTDFDLSRLVATCRQGELCMAQAAVAAGDAGVRSLSAQDLSQIDANPLIMTWQAFTLLKSTQSAQASSTAADDAPMNSPSLRACEVKGRLAHIHSPVELLEINQRVLAGDFPGLIIPGKMVADGIWVGRHGRLHPTARLEAPILIGDHCNIQGGAVLRSGSLIGNQVIVDEGASVQGSLVLDGTYVGPHTDLRDVVVKKNWMLQIPSLLSIHLGDDLILGDLEKQTVAAHGDRLINLVLALMLLILASPLMLFLYLCHLVLPPRKYLFSETRVRAYAQNNLEGVGALKTFDQYAFKSRNRLVRKLPGLFHVVRGELSLVGISALTEEEEHQLPEEWREMRQKAPVGLFHLWELEAPQDFEWEEKMVMENYYAVSRSRWGDLKILGKGLLATAFR